MNRELPPFTYSGNQSLIEAAHTRLALLGSAERATEGYRQFYLRDLGSTYRCPIERNDVDAIRDENERWLIATGICRDEAEFKHFQKIDCAGVAALTYANEPQSIVQLGADLIAWLFLFDDRFGEGKGMDSIEEITAVMTLFHTVIKERRVIDYNCPYQVAIITLLDRALSFIGDEWLERFANSIERYYFAGCLEEFRLRKMGETPTLARYLEIRRNSIAALPVLDLLDLRHGKLVRGTEDLREVTAGLLAWVNDVGSFWKEFKDGDVCNLVAIVSKYYDISIDAALDVSVAIHHNEYANFEKAATHFLKESMNASQSHSYVRALYIWASGNYHWCLRTKRYSDLG